MVGVSFRQKVITSKMGIVQSFEHAEEKRESLWSGARWYMRR